MEHRWASLGLAYFTFEYPTVLHVEDPCLFDFNGRPLCKKQHCDINIYKSKAPHYQTHVLLPMKQNNKKHFKALLNQNTHHFERAP